VVYPALDGRATYRLAPCGSATTGAEPASAFAVVHRQRLEVHMLRGGLLWLIGIPLPIILLLFFFGFLH
jgi:hypothetical protein